MYSLARLGRDCVLSSVFTSLIKAVNYLLKEYLTLENSSILMLGVMLTFLSR